MVDGFGFLYGDEEFIGVNLLEVGVHLEDDLFYERDRIVRLDSLYLNGQTQIGIIVIELSSDTYRPARYDDTEGLGGHGC